MKTVALHGILTPLGSAHVRATLCAAGRGIVGEPLYAVAEHVVGDPSEAKGRGFGVVVVVVIVQKVDFGSGQVGQVLDESTSNMAESV